MAHVPLSEQIYRHSSLLADDRIVTSDCPAMLFGRDTHAENAFSRYKRTFGGGLRAKRDKAQEREASMACQLLNRMQELGRPLSYPVR